MEASRLSSPEWAEAFSKRIDACAYLSNSIPLPLWIGFAFCSFLTYSRMTLIVRVSIERMRIWQTYEVERVIIRLEILTCQDEATNSRDESSEESIIRECANSQHIQELKDARSHDEHQVDIDELETNGSILVVRLC
jgi:hypothetical protein